MRYKQPRFMRTSAVTIMLSLSLFFSHLCQAEIVIAERIEVSGFARIVGGYLDTDEAEFIGYDNSVSFDQESLFGLQLDAQISESFSFTTQLIAHTSELRSSGVEWAYLSYTPNRNWMVRVGKQRTPFYNYSDVLDVGYAYPYITAPLQVYNNYFTTYEGINVQYQTSFGDVLVTTEGFWGSFDDELVLDGETFEPNVDNLFGIIFKANYGSFEARFGQYSADVNFDLPGLDPFIEQLQQLGFNQTANSLLIDDRVQFQHLALSYTELSWYLEMEASLIKSDLLIIPDINSYSLTAGYHFETFSIFGYFADLDAEYEQPINEIPIGLDLGLDQLAFTYQGIYQQLGLDNLRSITLGASHQLTPSVTIKSSVTFLEGDPNTRSFFNSIADPSFDRKANLYQIALEWVF